MEHARSDNHGGNDSDGEAAPLNHSDRDHRAQRQSTPSQIAIPQPASRPSSSYAQIQQTGVEDQDSQTRKPSPSARPEEVHYHDAVIWLFSIYALIAILSWTFTCTLTYHPIGISTWHDQYGSYTIKKYRDSDRVRRASSVGLSVISALGIPITSAIAARAAAAYCQQNSPKGTRVVKMRQMLALADKGWAGYEHVRDMLRPRRSKAVRTPLLVFVTSLIITAFFLPVLQSIFVSTKQVKVYAKYDRNIMFVNYPGRQEVGDFITPTDVIEQNFNRTISKVISDTINGQFSDSQPNLWTTKSNAKNLTTLGDALRSASNIAGYKGLAQDFFTSSIPAGINTGVVRNLATRMNTSVDCQMIPQSEFPTDCSRKDAFYREFSNMVNDSDPFPFDTVYPYVPKYRGRICAPGQPFGSPWKNIAERQDIREELWIDFQYSDLYGPKFFGGYNVGIKSRSNFTQHCTSNSTLGFYEVPNYWNGGIVGPLLSQIPPLSRNFTFDNHLSLTRRLSDSLYPVPGPLMASTHAIFGRNTFFDVVAEPKTNGVLKYDPLAEVFCSQLQYPFLGLVPSETAIRGGTFLREFSDWDIPTAWPPCPSRQTGSSPLLIGLMTYMPQFANTTSTVAALTFTAHSVHKHIFTTATEGYAKTYQREGTTYRKPEMPMPAMIVITLLLAFQLCGLGFLAIYAWVRPSWTETLDAKAVLKIGAEIAQTMDNGRDHIPGGIRLETSHEQMTPLLDQTEGWVGRVDRDENKENMHADHADDGFASGVNDKRGYKELVLGGRRSVRLIPHGTSRAP